MNPLIETFFLKRYGRFSSDSNKDCYFVDDYRAPLIGVPIAIRYGHLKKLYPETCHPNVLDGEFIYFLDGSVQYTEKEMLKIIQLKAFI